LISGFFRSCPGWLPIHTTNDAHKYLREPPPVKLFPIETSITTNRKSSGQTGSKEWSAPLSERGVKASEKSDKEGVRSEEFVPSPLAKEAGAPVSVPLSSKLERQ
jgi:hypothetical protein